MTAKLIRTVAHARRQAPPYGKVAGSEAIELRTLSPWVRWLLLELRMLCNFSSGYLVSSWAQLVALMDCDGNGFAPSREAIRRGIEQLSELGFVMRYATAGRDRKQLFLWVKQAPRIALSADSADRRADRPRTRRKAPLPTDVPTGVSATNTQSPKPLSRPVDKPTHTALAMQARMKPNGSQHPKI